MADESVLSFISPQGLQELRDALLLVEQLTTSLKEANKNQIGAENRTAASAGVNELKKNISALNAVQEENLQTLNQLKLAEDKVIQTMAKLTALNYESAKSEAALRVQLQERSRKLTEEARQNNDLYQQRKRNEQVQKDEARAAAALAREQAKQAAAAAKLEQPYNRLADLHRRLADHASQLGARFGVTSKEFETAANRANAVRSRLSEINAMLGNHRMNVGNYASAWNGLNHQVGMVLRELPNLGISLNTFVLSLSNNLPMLFDEIKKVNDQNRVLIEQGKPTVSALKQMLAAVLGWQTALIVGVTLLTKYGDQIFDFFTGVSKSSKEAEKATKKYEETIKSVAVSARNTANEEIARIQVLNALAADNTQSTRARTRAVKELQETYPATFGALERQEILEGRVSEAVNKTTEALLARASMQAAEKRFAAASERVYDLVVAQRTAINELSLAEDKYAKQQQKLLSRGIRDSRSDMGAFGVLSDSRRVETARENLDKITKQVEEAQKIQDQYLQDALRFGRQAGDTIFGKDTKNRSGSGSEYDPTGDDLKQYRDYTQELMKLDESRLRRSLEENRIIWQDETKTLRERLDAYREYQMIRGAIAANTADAELKDIQNRLAAIAELEGRDRKEYTVKEKRLLDEKEALLVAEKRAREELAAETVRIAREASTDIVNIHRSEAREIISTLALISEETQESERRDLDALYQAQSEGKLSIRQYRAEVAEIRNRYSQIELGQIVSFLENEITLLREQGVEVRELEKSLFEYRQKLREQELKEKELSARKGWIIDRETIQGIKRVSDESKKAFTQVGGIITDVYDRQSEDVKRQIDELDRLSESEINRINKSALAEEEKQRRIAKIEADTFAKRQVLEAKNIQILRKRAAFEKAANIASIISETALAVVTTLSDKTIQPAWARIPVAAAIGVAGAAQLARAISAPLPQYYTGVDSSPEGFAWTGERGTEMKITPSGKVSLTPNRATIDYLEKGTRIIPHEPTMNILSMLGMSAIPIPGVREKEINNRDLIDALSKQTDKLERAYKKQPNIVINNYGGWDNYISRNVKGTA